MNMIYRDTLEPIREIAREIFSAYDQLDPVRDTHLIFELIARANRLKYERMGITATTTITAPASPRFPHLIGKGIKYGNVSTKLSGKPDEPTQK